MKLLVVLFAIVGLCATLYVFIIHLKHIQWKVVGVLAVFGLILMSLVVIMVYQSSKQPDTYCDHYQHTMSYPPTDPKTAMDFFERGNYDYDKGDCKQAVIDYAKSIDLNSKYPQAYNNKAYTEMRMQNYKDALVDLNSALALNPNYINALMNRGDIHNSYFEIDRSAAIADYEKVISLAGRTSTGVCGHLFLAKHNGWNFGTILDFPWGVISCRSGK